MPRAADAHRRSAWIPWLIVAGFFVVIGANGALIYAAVGSFSGLETDQPYARGLAYNQILEEARVQERLGWTVSVDLQPAGDPQDPAKTVLEARFTGGDGKPLNALQVHARVMRPARAGADVAVDLDPDASGRYRTSLALPLDGQWDVDLDASGPTGRWHSRQRVFLRR